MSFTFTGAIQTYLVPETGEYEITLAGAQGGSSSDGNAGGMGAIVGGDIFLKQNELLDIFVGGQGYGLNGYAGGGGGGTFLGNPKKVFFIAGGGGGGGSGDRSIADGRPAAPSEAAATGGAATAAMADRVDMAAKAAKTPLASMAAAAAA